MKQGLLESFSPQTDNWSAVMQAFIYKYVWAKSITTRQLQNS